VGRCMAFVLLLVAVLGPTTVEASAGPQIHGPHQLRPGHKARLSISGFPSGARIRLQVGVHTVPPQNCCVSYIYPRLGHPAIPLGADGGGTVHMRIPRRYARCVTAACSHPDLTPYKCGQHVFVSAFTNYDSDNYTLYVGVISCKG
jgi:hypothetical protein